MHNPNQERCNCGDTALSYYPDENQYEPNCWDCYYQMRAKPGKTIVGMGTDDLPF